MLRSAIGKKWAPVLVGAVAAAMVTAFITVGMKPAKAAFPGANDQIVFTSSRDGTGDHEIYVANPDGSNQRRLTFSAAGESGPVWSPNGKIAFSRHNRYTLRGGLYTMDADGGDVKLVVRSAYAPAWSPSGTKIVFTRGCDLYTINADGSGQRNITSAIGVCANDPVWSPNGRRIAFHRSARDVNDRGIYTISTRGTDLRRLTVGNGSDPDWSPDGTKLVFQGYDRATDASTISTVNADGSGHTVLRTGGLLWAPVFSPDGTKIAYYGLDHAPGYQIYTMNSNGSGTPTALTRFGGNYGPDWRPGP